MNAHWMRIAVVALVLAGLPAVSEARRRGRFGGGFRGGFGNACPPFGGAPGFGGFGGFGGGAYGAYGSFAELGPYNTFGFAPVDGTSVIGSGPYDPYRDARDPYGVPVYPAQRAPARTAQRPAPSTPSPSEPAARPYVYTPPPAPAAEPEPPREPAQPKTIEITGEGVRVIKRNGLVEVVR